jgi:GT2 family glycosyltransferase
VTHQIYTIRCGESGPNIPEGIVCVVNNRHNHFSPCRLYQKFLEHPAKPDICIHLHDDLTIHDPDWLPRLLEPFSRPDVVAVGFGGAAALGNWDLHRKPWQLQNMARRGYCSNQTDAETHGERFTGTCRVAVLDAFCMAVRRDWLLSRGGWPVEHLTHHCLDLWLSCEAALDDREIWVTGVSCTHSGGGSSTKPAYREAKWLQGGTLESDHILPHKWLWSQYQSILPIEV